MQDLGKHAAAIVLVHNLNLGPAVVQNCSDSWLVGGEGSKSNSSISGGGGGVSSCSRRWVPLAARCRKSGNGLCCGCRPLGTRARLVAQSLELLPLVGDGI